MRFSSWGGRRRIAAGLEKEPGCSRQRILAHAGRRAGPLTLRESMSYVPMAWMPTEQALRGRHTDGSQTLEWRSTMKATLPFTKLKRYSEVAVLLWKYGRSGLANQLSAAGIEDPADGNFPGRAPEPEELADDLEAMGPTFIKLGQVL